MNKNILYISVIISFFTLCCAPILEADDTRPNERYFENMSLFLHGRFQYNTLFPIYRYPGGLFVGSVTDLNVTATGIRFEGYRIHIFNMTYRFSTVPKTYGNETLLLKNATGVFFLGAFIKRQRIVPPLLIISCHAEKVWIRWK